MNTRVWKVQATEDGSLQILAYLRNDVDGSRVVQAQISAISVKVFPPSGSAYSATPAVNSVIFDTLQQDARWPFDDDGYNFLHVLPPDAFPVGGKHRIEYRFTAAGGQVYWLLIDAEAEEVKTS
jgi:hypothetical protein